MDKVPFDITLSGMIKIDAGKITLTIDKAQTTVDLEPSTKSDARFFLRKGQTLFDIVLNTAQEFVASEGQELRFSAADLYHLALDKYPHLKRNSWTSHVIASAPNHPSYNHFATKKNYFRYLGDGTYKLEDMYIGDEDDK